MVYDDLYIHLYIIRCCHSIYMLLLFTILTTTVCGRMQLSKGYYSRRVWVAEAVGVLLVAEGWGGWYRYQGEEDREMKGDTRTNKHRKWTNTIKKNEKRKTRHFYTSLGMTCKEARVFGIIYTIYRFGKTIITPHNQITRKRQIGTNFLFHSHLDLQ